MQVVRKFVADNNFHRCVTVWNICLLHGGVIKVENECTSYNFSLFAIFLPKIIKLLKFDEVLTTTNAVFWDTV